MAESKFGLDIDGNRITMVEVLNDTAVNMKSVSLDNINDSVALILAGIKDKNDDVNIRGLIALPKTALRRIDVTSNLRTRKDFEDEVYSKLTVSRENTTAAGLFFRPELMEGDTVSPGVAVVAPSDAVDSTYRAFGRRIVELVPPPFAYSGWDGLWLGLRFDTAELTLVRDNRVVAYRQMQIGGLGTVVGLLSDPSSTSIGFERVENTLKGTLDDPIAKSELDRYFRKVLSECQQTVRFWKQSGEEVGDEIFSFGIGGSSELLDICIAEVGFKKVFPSLISKQLSFIPLSERDLAVGAFFAAKSFGYDMPQASYINTAILEFKDKDAKKKLIKTGLTFAGVALGLSLVFGGLPYFIGLKGKIDINNDYNKVQIEKDKYSNDIKLYREIKLREQLIDSILAAEPNWAETLSKSMDYLPQSVNIDSIQAVRDNNNLSVTINATFKGSAYNGISKWLDDIKVSGGATSAWMSNFSVREGKTSCQVNYIIPLSKVMLIKNQSTEETPASDGLSNTEESATIGGR